ncbi:helix-turn-helix domain-containing protein [Cohnella algarum]|uniref:helix-turn-helix domain-containing protein n=1 Tax=Cohnella algarum TaxID=2044859 RepID=UPI0019680ABC|nr:helix-turn-helix domain-containing protein [Cohnella algarum]MBN2980154.1 helix-turn-helix domain-containing protein [Cohnella algarum]
MTVEQTFAAFVEQLREQLKAELMNELRAELHTVPDRTLSFAEACDHLNMSDYTLRRLCREKRIPHRVYGSEGSKNPRYLFSSRRLDQWIRDQEEANYLPRGAQTS